MYKKSLYEYVYPVLDKRTKPNLSNAALETLAIVAYNPQITRAEIEAIRGVSADACVYKLLEYGLIEEAGKLIYQVSLCHIRQQVIFKNVWLQLIRRFTRTSKI